MIFWKTDDTYCGLRQYSDFIMQVQLKILNCKRSKLSTSVEKDNIPENPGDLFMFQWLSRCAQGGQNKRLRNTNQYLRASKTLLRPFRTDRVLSGVVGEPSKLFLERDPLCPCGFTSDVADMISCSCLWKFSLISSAWVKTWEKEQNF